jgi:hypothetical protein
MKHAFIKAHQEAFSITLCCELFDVSRSDYYDWLKRERSNRELANRRLDIKISALFGAAHQRAGSPRITLD